MSSSFHARNASTAPLTFMRETLEFMAHNTCFRLSIVLLRSLSHTVI